MKAIMMSIKPKWVAKILNGIKTIEIRKRFPKDYVGWVYIYCTKVAPNKQDWLLNKDNKGNLQNPYGKVVARFWCDRVEEIKFNDKVVQEKSCLTEDELFDYLFINEPYHEDMHKGYGIYITKLEIFDKPEKLSEFIKCDNNHIRIGNCFIGFGGIPRLTKAPQSWCYIETAVD